tara:strand:+ start:748 stop:954 length:207 start_codon:yes stop_codon:yes gene_type:complete
MSENNAALLQLVAMLQAERDEALAKAEHYEELYEECQQELVQARMDDKEKDLEIEKLEKQLDSNPSEI